MHKTTILAAFMILLGVACDVSDSDMNRTLQSAGYSQIENTGHAYLACGKDDNMSSSFKAINPAGKPVTGTVCCGWLKGCTIRF